MAWTSTGSSNAELIDNMLRNGILGDVVADVVDGSKSEAEAASGRIARAMKKVDRANYVRDKRDAYEDSPQSIGHGATISAPHMHAYAASHLLPYLPPRGRVLDVGSGSGYMSAVLYHLMDDPHGQEPPTPTLDGNSKPLITGIEHISQLTDWSISNLKRDGLGEALERGQIEMVTGDGRLGYPSNAPYHAIHVGAAAPELPQELVDQLAPGGRMFIPIGTYMQNIYHVDKDKSGKVTQTEVMGVRYVPLTDRNLQKEF
ncbi:protein-L-isoaspartate O-methyltransferase [Lentinula aciculospora]|uniref:Protein-L-isoaspartate O-methyltransferase n=1 Tax=Lentinula aciculospora TaxID=153920 RepID=A0A9W9DX11_9AGAR|nr:protein-L-isoaspartate O-methyltransferase [Lentinula aciculospora]